jgi:hypothetical protein
MKDHDENNANVVIRISSPPPPFNCTFTGLSNKSATEGMGVYLGIWDRTLSKKKVALRKEVILSVRGISLLISCQLITGLGGGGLT